MRSKSNIVPALKIGLPVLVAAFVAVALSVFAGALALQPYHYTVVEAGKDKKLIPIAKVIDHYYQVPSFRAWLLVALVIVGAVLIAVFVAHEASGRVLGAIVALAAFGAVAYFSREVFPANVDTAIAWRGVTSLGLAMLAFAFIAAAGWWCYRAGRNKPADPTSATS